MTATANVHLVSQYRFRGIDQTWGRPALQGGVDLAWPAGWYAGLWASNVSGRSYAGASAEVDLYAGYNGRWSDDLSYTVGAYGYWYPGGNTRHAVCPSAAFPAPCALPAQRYDTFELNAGITWKWLSYKLSYAATDYFGASVRTGYSQSTRGTLYHDLNLSIPVSEGWTLAAHVGRTDVRGSYGGVNADYTDWRLAATRSFDPGWVLSAAVVGASNSTFFAPPVGGLSASSNDTRRLNRTTLVLQAGRTF